MLWLRKVLALTRQIKAHCKIWYAVVFVHVGSYIRDILRFSFVALTLYVTFWLFLHYQVCWMSIICIVYLNKIIAEVREILDCVS